MSSELPKRPSVRVVLLRFSAMNALLFLVVTGLNLFQARILGVLAVPFLAAVWIEYTALYLLAAMLPAMLLAICGGRARAIAPAVGAAAATITAFFLFVDATIFRMYGFHWNDFVWNLLTTRGGIESMDGGVRMWLGGALVLLVIAAIQIALLHFARRDLALWRLATPARPRRAAFLLVGALMLLGVSERLAFAVANFSGCRAVTVAQDVFPFYLRTRMRKVAVALGLDRRDDLAMRDVRGSLELRYPVAPLRQEPTARRLNVVWLVAESWRSDTVIPDLMPSTVAFAERALWFKNHYSGGNCTRMGVFSMFYGVYGCYWFPFLAAERGPVLVDRLLDGGWQFMVSTSARFTFPEFDKTVWSRFPLSDLTEGDGKKTGWENDRELSDRMLKRIDERDPSRPFFAFHFFESPHARYHFPPECAVREPYCDVVDYALLTAADMPEVKNRYLNSVNHLDTQFAKIFRHLGTRGLLDSTIVVLTGDHGEEFMEKGRYGHHSAFSEEQTRAPLILWIPGESPRSLETLSSHLDLPATILARLGVVNEPADYSLGIDLLGSARRDHVVLADWDHLCIRDAVGKGSFSLSESGMFDWEATTIDDSPFADPDHWVRQASATLGLVARAQRRFTR